jgi:uncharacterized protein DUF5995
MEQTVAALVARMEADLETLDDGRRYFHATYLRTTKAVGEEIERGGFADNAWLERWDLVFADLYRQALASKSPPRPWHVAFDAAHHRVDLPPLRHVLLGMNAHINYDLPQALLAVIDDADFDRPEVLAARERDHKRIDGVLAARVSAEDLLLRGQSAPRARLDRALTPLNRAATRRFLRESREKVWHNTHELHAARRAGPEVYARRLAHLEVLSAARIRDLLTPGQVLARLAIAGFGVALPPEQASPARR